MLKVYKKELSREIDKLPRIKQSFGEAGHPRLAGYSRSLNKKIRLIFVFLNSVESKPALLMNEKKEKNTKAS